MKEPLKAGDVCKVVGGQGRGKSPNLGKTVTIVHRVYGDHGADHSRYGPIYSCSGTGVMQLSDAGGYITTGQADFAGDWLERINPDALPLEGKVITLETTT